MAFKEKIALCFKNCMEEIDKLCGQNVQLLNFTANDAQVCSYRIKAGELKKTTSATSSVGNVCLTTSKQRLLYQAHIMGHESSAGIATCYGLDLSEQALGSTQSLIQWILGLFPEGKRAGGGTALNTHPYLTQGLKKEQNYTPICLRGLRGRLQSEFNLIFLYYIKVSTGF
jgi:hypothetical protein